MSSPPEKILKNIQKMQKILKKLFKNCYPKCYPKLHRRDLTAARKVDPHNKCSLLCMKKLMIIKEG